MDSAKLNIKQHGRYSLTCNEVYEVDKTLLKIEDLLSELDDKFSYINSGGCGVVASLLANKLYKLGFRTKVKSMLAGHQKYRPKKYLRDIIIEGRNNARQAGINNFNSMDFQNAGVSFGHLVCVLSHKGKDYVLDTDHGVTQYNEYEKEHYKLNKYSFTHYEAARFASEAKGWNDMFDRNQIPGMAEIINSFEV